MNTRTFSGPGMISFLVASLILIFQGPASAYIDPGTGSYAFQMAIAGIVGGVYTVKLFWRRITRSLSSLLTRGKGETDAA